MVNPAPAKPPRRILFLAEGQLGDLLLLTPALRAAKESFPESRITVFVIERRTTDLDKKNRFDNLRASTDELSVSPLATNPHVDELLVLSREALRAQKSIARLRAEASVLRHLRRLKPDAVVCTFPEDRFAEWAFASGAKIRIGQHSQPLVRLLTHTPDIEKKRIGVLRYYCKLVEAMGVKVRTFHTEYHVSAESSQWGTQALARLGIDDRPFVALHPGASGEYKIWPPDRFAELLRRLSRELHVEPMLVYGASDRPIVTAVLEHLQDEVKMLETGVDIGRLAAILERASLCISNDSGPRHLAVAVGTPTLTLFRRHHDREWGVYDAGDRCVIVKGEDVCPVCPPEACHDLRPPGETFGSYCLRMISVDDVVRRTADILATG